MPLAVALRLIIVKLAFKVRLVRVDPLSLHQLARLEGAHVLHSCVFEDVGSLSVFLALFPLPRVNVLIGVNHNSLAMPLAQFPVAVVGADSGVELLAYSMLLVILPSTLISIRWLLRVFVLTIVGVSAVGPISQLFRQR